MNMNKRTFRLFSLQFGMLSLLLFTLSCLNNPADDDDDTPDDEKPAVFVDFWQFGIPKVQGITTDSIYVNLDIAADSTYELELVQANGKMLLSHHGEWESSDDSIFLTGTECMLLDTATEPDSLKPLDDSICSSSIALKQPPETGTWNVKLGDLEVLIQAFPVDEMMIAFLKPLDINLERTEK